MSSTGAVLKDLPQFGAKFLKLSFHACYLLKLTLSNAYISYRVSLKKMYIFLRVNIMLKIKKILTKKVELFETLEKIGLIIVQAI